MDDLKIIRKKYGEKMMHLCRELFPTILETPGVLSTLMLKHFEPSKFLYDDIINSDVEGFENYIYSFIDGEKENPIITDKTPEELLEEAGYTLYECKTEEEIQSFRKYYKQNEELCTFTQGDRLNRCYVFFAIKKNANDTKRKRHPQRQDEYGTSVISIQFNKDVNNTLSIKNRYNHTVNNPDSTFGNNLDNIIPGLTESFKKTYHLNFENNNKEYELPNYVCVADKYYKYNFEHNNVYFCPNNIIIDNFRIIDKYSKEPERYIVFDYFILDLKEKNIIAFHGMDDTFGNEFKNIEKITVSKDKETDNKNIEILYDNDKKATIIINKYNQMIEYHNDFQTKMEDNCLEYVDSLTTFNTPKLTEMGDGCLPKANSLTIFNASNLTKMGFDCLVNANSLTTFNAPNLTKMGDYCLGYTNNLITFNAPNLTKMEFFCLKHAANLTTFNAPNLTKMGDDCLAHTNNLTTFNAPNLTKMGDDCLTDADNLATSNAPKVRNAPKTVIDNLNQIIKGGLYKFKKFAKKNMEQLGGTYRK